MFGVACKENETIATSCAGQMWCLSSTHVALNTSRQRLTVNFQEVVQSVRAGNTDVARPQGFVWGPNEHQTMLI